MCELGKRREITEMMTYISNRAICTRRHPLKGCFNSSQLQLVISLPRTVIAKDFRSLSPPERVWWQEQERHEKLDKLSLFSRFRGGKEERKRERDLFQHTPIACYTGRNIFTSSVSYSPLVHKRKKNQMRESLVIINDVFKMDHFFPVCEKVDIPSRTYYIPRV